MTETVLALARKAGEHLAARGIENGRLEAELLLASVLGVKRLDLYLQHDRPVRPAELEEYRSRVRRRLRREPLQYITGEAAFRTLVVSTDPRALIPRPETEILVAQVLAWGRGRAPVSALDVGTGTGAIALSLVAEGHFAPVVATDVSTAALALARENAERLGLAPAIEFRVGPLFDPVRADEAFDVIVSNPPYVAESDRETLPSEVRDHEPAAALFAGADGLDVLTALVDGAPEVLRPGGLLALEVGPGQAQSLAARIDADPRYTGARVVQDLSGRPRIVLAETCEERKRADGV